MGFAFGIGAVLALSVFWGGFAAMTLWGWFAVPLGVKAITYWQAIGLKCLVDAFVGVQADSVIKGSATRGEAIQKGLLWGALTPTALLAVGWAAHWLMVQEIIR
ncbi:hypothetical protein N0754_19520 [Pseudomonas aeruginosa]|nr:hypothetical protein [Pseudomonas aeruginosa]MCS9764427.1 hypothetical protein [Pseudomonas aeruginosa]MCS9822467.1 hypothetical protein [Pseudomonas aeruginosa]MCT0241184.1 hypothetical protein [Pseudomonas aeruginosa]MCT0530032.1 hypothetical protein [Pseudomonas aeruginosa]